MGISTAHKAKKRRADALARLEDGVWLLHDVLDTVPRPLTGVPVHIVLCATPGMGPVTMRTVLERSNVWPLSSLGTLSEYERDAIRNYLPERIR